MTAGSFRPSSTGVVPALSGKHGMQGKRRHYRRKISWLVHSSLEWLIRYALLHVDISRTRPGDASFEDRVISAIDALTAPQERINNYQLATDLVNLAILRQELVSWAIL